MGTLRTVLSIIQIVLTLGPKIIKLAKEVWEIVEEFSHRKENDKSFEKYDGEKASTEEKVARFNAILRATKEGRGLTDKQIDKLRELAHSMKT